MFLIKNSLSKIGVPSQKSVSSWQKLRLRIEKNITKITHLIFSIASDMSYDQAPETEASAAASDIGPEDEQAGSDQCFSKSGVTMRNQKKISEKMELGKERWHSQMGQVGTCWSTWDRWDRDRGSPY